MKLKDIGFVRCIGCAVKLFPAFIGAEDIELNNAPLLHGTAVEWHIGYGSDFDGDTLYLGLCDRCIKQKKEEGTLKHVPIVNGF